MTPHRIKTISEFHSIFNLPKPEHPLISVVDYALLVKAKRDTNIMVTVSDYYSISVKRGLTHKMRYGQQEYDFDEGVMYFLAPGQVLHATPVTDTDVQASGWILLIHPDFLWHSPLADMMQRYEFFDYTVHEALFLSDKEEVVLQNIIDNIKQEYHSNIDRFSQNIIISQLETLLNYAERFYQRQFITRKITNNQLLDRLDKLLRGYFQGDDLLNKGLPTVQYVAHALNVSPGYLSSLLKVLTGQSTQQHIHEKLIDKAKAQLSTTEMTVSEIAYGLGFEHPQSFSKLFKSKTNVSPLEFRASFN
jgi:AraC family transcriptional activator of pobA